ncbi:MAG: polyhydroxyalkanoate synthesis repressor PhaR [Bauldia litoralis]
MASDRTRGDDPIVIKKYANRRLYKTATSSYVTLDDLCLMVKEHADFVVYDAKSGEDITRSVLTQIIVEEESKGQNLLPVSFLRQLIGFYGDSLQGLVPKYLEQSMDSFAENQEQMRGYLSRAFDGMFPFGSIEDMNKKNMALFEQTLSMLNPFQAPPGSGGSKTAQTPSNGNHAPESPTTTADPLSDLQKKIDVLQQQVEALTRTSKSDKDA